MTRPKKEWIERIAQLNNDTLADDAVCGNLLSEAITAMADMGMTEQEIANALKTSRPTIKRWREKRSLPLPMGRESAVRLAYKTILTRTVAAHIETLRDWNDDGPPFADLVSESMVYATLLGHGERFAIELTDELEILPNTLERWANGVSFPHPRIKKVALSTIARRLSLCLEQATTKDGDVRA